MSHINYTNDLVEIYSFVMRNLSGEASPEIMQRRISMCQSLIMDMAENSEIRLPNLDKRLIEMKHIVETAGIALGEVTPSRKARQ